MSRIIIILFVTSALNALEWNYGNEILSWLKHHPEAGRWIVIDDLDLHNDIIRQHQIKTDQTVGLTSQDIEHAKIMLMDTD